jgi:hypothetical protein
MRGRWLWLVLAACGSSNGNGDEIAGTYSVHLVAGSNSCGADYSAYFDQTKSVEVSGSGVVVSSMTAIDVTRDGGDLAFTVSWQDGTPGGDDGYQTGDESYMLTGDASELSGSATASYEIQAFPPCSLELTVTTTGHS